ncbi:MAG: hypothetical protein RL199_739 [Pseudomonadota bacterium]|jgi:hypothetical protein
MGCASLGEEPLEVTVGFLHGASPWNQRPGEHEFGASAFANAPRPNPREWLDMNRIREPFERFDSSNKHQQLLLSTNGGGD